jgi:FtsP/CotA-like multicopper oxidase with cupredoxin domain
MRFNPRWITASLFAAAAFALGLVLSAQSTSTFAQQAEATPDPMAGMDMSGTSAQGMDMTGMQYMSAEDMAAMAAHMAPISSDNIFPAPNDAGLQPLDYVLEDGFKVFDLVARPYLWNILPNVQVVAWTYNGMVPGPLIRVTQGDRVRINLRNELPEPTTLHLHGIWLEWNMDGMPHVSQPPIEPGQSFTYEFEVDQPAGTYWYHSHYHEDFQIGLGLHGALIIDPATPEENPPDVDVTLMINEVRTFGGLTFASMPMGGMEPNYFTLNGKSYPNVPPIVVEQGQRIRIRFIAAGQFLHPMHLHGHAFEVVGVDGMPVPENQRGIRMDTVTVAPGQRFDIEFVAARSGPWMIHCHIPHHTTNNFSTTHGGLMVAVVVR